VSIPDGDYEELVGVASAIFEATGGDDALDRLEWDPQARLDDPEWRHTLGAVFEAQGMTLASTPALNRVVASAYGIADRRMAVAASAATPGIRLLCLAETGKAGASGAVLDDAGSGLVAFAAIEPDAWPGGPLDESVASWFAAGDSSLIVAGERIGGARRLALTLARVAVAHEILGASGVLLRLAVDYAKDRKQFDRPIGSYQALQHLLAQAEVERRALRDACRATLWSLGSPDPAGRDNQGPVLLKALAGRAGRRVAQATQQAFGAIGFTWEHHHHRYHRRILTLDALFGSVDELRPQLAVVGGDGRLWRAPVL
jgi:hypothetical protein